MEAAGADADLLKLVWGGVSQARGPGERDAEDAAVAERDPYGVFVEAYCCGAN